MTDLFSVEMRRDPFPFYKKVRGSSPVLHLAPFDAWLVFGYDEVKQVLNNHEAFTSRVGPEWLVFLDPPRHSKLRALISQAFTPKSISLLEPRIRELSHELLEPCLLRGEMDLAAEYSVPLPMQVICEMIGLRPEDRPRFQKWSDAMLALSEDFFGGTQGARAIGGYRTATAEMHEYLEGLIAQRRQEPKEDLLTRLINAEVDGERLTHAEILAFFQLLLVAGQETTTNLLNNAVLCFSENPRELARWRAAPELLPSAIEEVLRYRSPFQWTLRSPTRPVTLGGTTIPAGKRVLAMMGSANRDAAHFAEPDRFKITRNPNPHLAFGYGIHFCLGAALARLEARVALSDLLEKMESFELKERTWEPRAALHVLGPARLPIRFNPRSNG
jgi:cytochrome P450